MACLGYDGKSDWNDLLLQDKNDDSEIQFDSCEIWK